MNTIRYKKKNTKFQSKPKKQLTKHASKVKRQSSILNTDQLVKKAATEKAIVYQSKNLFNDMPIDNKLKKNLVKKGYSKPSEIQEKSLNHLKSGRNLIGVANTGTGKTAAFLIPIIDRLLDQRSAQTALVVVPTRELALQVEKEFRSLTVGLELYASSFIGGTSVKQDLSKLKRKNHVIIGTPGRLIDLMNQKALHLERVPILVLDEFDRMLDMGFVRDIKRIVQSMRSRKQTMLFSATIDKTQKNLINELVSDAVEIKVNSGHSSSDRVDQEVIKVPNGANKFEMLTNLISADGFDKVLVFAETKRWVDRVAKKLNQIGIQADQIHGNKSQNYRNNALTKFKSGNIQVLVATDVAARGIDVNGVTHVINYQLPMTLDSYIHRIGRTGRAGQTGKAFTFVD